jgi:hypothetical protein
VEAAQHGVRIVSVTTFRHFVAARRTGSFGASPALLSRHVGGEAISRLGGNFESGSWNPVLDLSRTPSAARTLPGEWRSRFGRLRRVTVDGKRHVADDRAAPRTGSRRS